MIGRTRLGSRRTWPLHWSPGCVAVVLLAPFAAAMAAPPSAGHEVALVSQVDPDASLTLVIPRGWRLRRLSPSDAVKSSDDSSPPRVESFTIEPEAAKVLYPYLLVTFDHDPPDLTSESWPEAELLGTPALEGSIDQPIRQFDAERNLVWSSTIGASMYRVLVELDRSGVRYALDFRHLPNRPPTFDPTIVKVVDGLRVGRPTEASNEEHSDGSSSDPPDTDADEPQRRFEMWTAKDEATLWRGRWWNAAVALIGLLVLVGLYLLYLLVERRAIAERLEETTRAARRTRRGRRSRADDGLGNGHGESGE